MQLRSGDSTVILCNKNNKLRHLLFYRQPQSPKHCPIRGESLVSITAKGRGMKNKLLLQFQHEFHSAPIKILKQKKTDCSQQVSLFVLRHTPVNYSTSSSVSRKSLHPFFSFFFPIDLRDSSLHIGDRSPAPSTIDRRRIRTARRSVGSACRNRCGVA